MGIRKRWRFTAVLTLALLISCTARPISDLSCDRIDISSDPLPNLTVNTYIDGTPSMAGYVSTLDSRYIRTLDAVFNMLAQTTPATLTGELSSQPTVNYLRLGKNNSTGELAQALSGSQHLQASEPGFYNGSSFPALAVTQIEAAIESASAEQPSIIVTDLYQGEQYVNKIVGQIQGKLDSIEQGAVGIIGIRSEFNGTVYTEARRGTSSFQYNLTSTPSHPFYILLIGRVDEVSFYMNDLQQRLDRLDFQAGVEAVLFSPERLYRSIPVFERKERADFASLDPASNLDIPNYRMSYKQTRINLTDNAVQPLIIERNGDSVQVPFELAIQPIENIFYPDSLGIDFDRTHQSFDAIKQEFSSRENPSIDQALTVDNQQLGPDRFSYDLALSPAQFNPPGIYFFTLDATAQPANDSSEALLNTWADWSSDSTDSATNTDGSRTHNLDDFIEGLAKSTTAKMQQNPIPLGQQCYIVQSS
ncbi:MAG: hypothetical protein AAF716_11020 [Cyanobacteria bacterium P01_D01_bin.1]